jgi:MFS family permease
MKEGLTYVKDNKVMLWAISLDLFAVLFGGCIALLPIFAKDILIIDSDGYGHLRAAMPLGAAITMLFLARNPIRKDTGKWLMIFVGLFGLATLCFALSRSFYLSLFILFLMGAFDAVSVVIRGAILMLETPDHMRARVTSVNSIFISSSNEIGAFESGFAAQMLGTVRSVLFGGSMTLLFVTIAWNKAKVLRNYSMKG